MSKLLLLVGTFVFCFHAFAFEVSLDNQCNAKIQGGVDAFPWSVAQPFPWTDIQGVWKLKDGSIPLYLKAKVIRTTTNRKILNLVIVTEGNCTKAVATGAGFIDSTEKNVVRAQINDGSNKYQMKIAFFNINDVASNTFGCEREILAASLRIIGPSKSSQQEPTLLSSSAIDGSEIIMLKKISNDLSSICRKASF